MTTYAVRPEDTGESRIDDEFARNVMTKLGKLKTKDLTDKLPKLGTGEETYLLRGAAAQPFPPTQAIRMQTDEHAALERPRTIAVVPEWLAEQRAEAERAETEQVTWVVMGPRKRPRGWQPKRRRQEPQMSPFAVFALAMVTGTIAGAFAGAFVLVLGGFR